MYADFEAILEPIQEQGPKSLGTRFTEGPASRVSGDPNELYTKKVSQHIPSGWCVYSKFSYGEVKDPLKLRGFAITPGRKVTGCTTCFLKNPWIP